MGYSVMAFEHFFHNFIKTYFMKAAICIFTLMLAISCARAQKLETSEPRPKRHMCATTIVGIVALPLGLTATIGGLAMELSAGSAEERSGLPQSEREAQYQHDHNAAVAVIKTGVVLGIAGFGLLITGVVIDKEHNHKHRFSLVAPRANEIGFACNF
jgi:hypothetical protein